MFSTSIFKFIANSVAFAIVLPFIAICRIEGLCGQRFIRCFSFFAQLVALLPGYPGVCVRRVFYSGTIAKCSWECELGFGVLISARTAIVEKSAYVGSYALLGDVYLCEGCLIGSRASLLSKGQMHERNQLGQWSTPSVVQIEQLKIGSYSWLGEACVILADVGEGAMVAAGSVVAANVPPHIMVAGNPARFVKRFQDVPIDAKHHDSQAENSANWNNESRS
jgi:acetyltransferase-like isoleucine patch superfamily enzyme